MAELVINLPVDRTKVGTIELFDNSGNSVFRAPALGMADSQKAASEGNPSRISTLPYGHTPSGGYDVVGFRVTGPGHNHGPNGKIELNPVSGDALTAKTNGRTHLQIHGGALRNGNLRATWGCIRVSDEDMANLNQAIGALNVSTLSCNALDVAVTAGAAQGEDHVNHDGSDPPGDEGVPLSSLLDLGDGEQPTGGGPFSGGCVPGDCEVLLADGRMKPISMIEAGDKVLAVAFDSREVVDRQVVGNWAARSEALVGLKVSSDNVFWSSEDQSIITVCGPVKAAYIFHGASIRYFDPINRTVRVSTLEERFIERQSTPIDVFSLDLGGRFSFFAGNDRMEIACGTIESGGGEFYKL